MPEAITTSSTTTSTPQPPPVPLRTTTQGRAPLNQDWVNELGLSEQLAAIAEKTNYAERLSEEGIDTGFITNFRNQIKAADRLIGSVSGNSAGKKAITQHEDTLKKDLLSAVQRIQTRAKRKYVKTSDPMREKYFIGERIDSNRALLERSTRAILKTLESDTLPGLKPAHVTALAGALDAYVEVETDQTGGKTETSGGRAQLEAKVQEVAGLRRELQYAADLAWPADKKANAAIRREFKIPADRAVK